MRTGTSDIPTTGEIICAIQRRGPGELLTRLLSYVNECVRVQRRTRKTISHARRREVFVAG